ncbi:hypothetical protein MES5069_530030 [Mesorhizobium escarrei]|uniref:Uncharacterized protein n=1 Tax=Mesorhizobium escarrei TaxID=666018 RepID=A0ABM9ECU9_9HYPH|nr:hypothetical protein MES5069_530030 [Mesorhizobium escarrei]
MRRPARPAFRDAQAARRRVTGATTRAPAERSFERPAKLLPREEPGYFLRRNQVIWSIASDRR